MWKSPIFVYLPGGRRKDQDLRRTHLPKVTRKRVNFPFVVLLEAKQELVRRGSVLVFVKSGGRKTGRAKGRNRVKNEGTKEEPSLYETERAGGAGYSEESHHRICGGVVRMNHAHRKRKGRKLPTFRSLQDLGERWALMSRK